MSRPKTQPNDPILSLIQENHPTMVSNDIYLSELFGKQIINQEMATKKTATAKAEAAPKATTKKAAAAKTTKKVTFTLPKEAVEAAKTVAVVGEFNNWSVEAGYELKKQKDGSFKTTVELESGREYQYRFIVDGTTWVNAWDAPKYVATPFGVENSVVLA